MGFAAYLLIVAEFINWAKDHEIPVGPWPRLRRGILGRLRPCASPTSTRIRFELLIERFLNPERVSMPDVDVDFCQDRREEVIEHTRAEVRPRVRQRRSSPTASSRRRLALRDVARTLV
jgi:DNA polymerase-3 subunit alpha